MSGTRRTPIARQTMSPQITPRAAELWLAMRKVSRCACPPYPESFAGRECNNCNKWWDLHSELHTELRCKLWEWPAVPSPRRRGEWRGPSDRQVAMAMALNEVAKGLRAQQRAREAMANVDPAG
jgi:hypothetical protein